jgi:YcxB-like protein
MTLTFRILDEEYDDFMKNHLKKTLSPQSGNIKKYFIPFALIVIGLNVYSYLVLPSNEESKYLRDMAQWLTLICVFVGLWFFIMKNLTTISSKPKTKNWIPYVIGALVLLTIFVLGGSSKSQEEGSPNYLAPLIQWVVLISIFAGLWYFIFKRIRVNMKPQDYETIMGERTMIFEEDKIQHIGKNSETIYKWSAIKKWEQTQLNYLLYTASNIAIAIPKRVFENAMQQSDFESLINRKISTLNELGDSKILDA